MNKVLITGGAGFIGLSLARKLLEKGYKVDLVDNFSRAVKDDDLKEIEKNENISLKEINLLEASQVSTLSKDYFSIFHLAAIIGVQHVLNNPFLVLKDNIAMLLNIIDLACKQNDNFSRVVFDVESKSGLIFLIILFVCNFFFVIWNSIFCNFLKEKLG